MKKFICLLIAFALLSCDKKEQDGPEVIPPEFPHSELTFGSIETTRTLQLTTEQAWEITSSHPEWLTPQPASGTAGEAIKINVTVKENRGELRESKLLIRSGTYEFEINVTQTPVGTYYVDTPGTIRLALPENFHTFSELVLYGNLNDDDFRTLRIEATQLQSLDLRKVENLEELPKNAFAYHTSIEEVFLPENLVSTGDYAFRETPLKAIHFPKSLQKIGQGVFHSCDQLTEVVLSENITEIADYAFSTSGIENVVWNDKLESIGISAFWDCRHLLISQLPATLTTIDEFAFHNTDAFQGELVLPQGIETIHSGVFQKCPSITGIVFPTGLKNINNRAFEDCTGITSLDLPEGLKSINGGFFNCTGITGPLVLPQSLEEINDYSFANCTGLTGTLSIPDNVTDIGSSAFKGCTGFDKLILGESLRIIGPSAFDGCAQLTGTLVLGEEVITIYQRAFYGCENLKAVVMESQQLSYLGREAFAECTRLAGTFEIPASIQEMGDGTIKNTAIDNVIYRRQYPLTYPGFPSHVTLTVPADGIDLYYSLWPGWKEHTLIAL